MGWIIFGLLLYWLILMAERALVAVSPHDLEQLRSGPGPSPSRRLLAWSVNPRSALAALLLARVLVKVLLVVGLVAWLWPHPALRGASAPWAGLVVAFLLLALSAIFWGIGKLSLRWIVGTRPLVWLRRLSGFIVFWQRVFAIFIREKRTDDADDPGQHDADQDQTSAAATDEKRDIELLKSIVKFSDVTVKQIMQARSKVVAVDFRSSFHELLATVREAGFSRLPVCDEDLDNVTGILYVKDLVPHLDKPDSFEWQSLIRTTVLVVPEAKRVSELLQEFKQKKLHLAVVVDEYGGSAGIVTMEDILEEVTGEIRDEFDEESEIRYRKLDENNYLFEGQTLLNDVCRLAGLAPDHFDAARGTADTLAGLALELRGDIPAPGAEIAGEGYVLTITAADNRRIEQLKLTLPRS